MAHPSHKMDAYRDGYKWIAYCKKCGAEEYPKLTEVCPGKYVRETIDKKQEQT